MTTLLLIFNGLKSYWYVAVFIVLGGVITYDRIELADAKVSLSNAQVTIANDQTTITKINETAETYKKAADDASVATANLKLDNLALQGQLSEATKAIANQATAYDEKVKAILASQAPKDCQPAMKWLGTSVKDALKDY